MSCNFSPTPDNPSGVKVVEVHMANGIANSNTTLAIPSHNGILAMSTYFTFQSVSVSVFNMTVTSVAYFNTTLKFDPEYSLTGMALTVGSATVVASVAGIKREEY